jgi:hypothetical protein
MKARSMADIAEYIKSSFKRQEMILVISDGANSCTDNNNVSWDTAEGMYKTLTDPEVCDTNEASFYFTVCKICVLEGDSIPRSTK